MTAIRVGIPDTPYDVLVHPGLLDSVGPTIRQILPSARAAIVTDSNVGTHYLGPVQASLCGAGYDTIEVTIDAGEQHKNFVTLQRVYDTLLSAGIDRATCIVALGGGVVGDLAGFAAATLLRGLPFVQAPTSLLAMVDASVGGKTGVNHAMGKNLIGAFHQPRAVLIDPATLRTLPSTELSNGLAECIKHELIRDSAGFADLEQNLERALQVDLDYLTSLIAHNVVIKSRIVGADPLEKGERVHLNFGHTFGHAIERVLDFRIGHGQAVALGMIAAAHLSVSLKLLDERSFARIRTLVQRASLPVGAPNLQAERVLAAMQNDKKIVERRPRLVLLDRIGHAIVRDDVPDSLVLNAIEAIGS